MDTDVANALLYLRDTVNQQQDTLEEAKKAFEEAGYALDWLEGIQAIQEALVGVTNAEEAAEKARRAQAAYFDQYNGPHPMRARHR